MTTSNDYTRGLSWAYQRLGCEHARLAEEYRRTPFFLGLFLTRKHYQILGACQILFTLGTAIFDEIEDIKRAP